MVAAAALNHRAVTGEGNYVDFSMAEALTASIPEALLDYQMNDRVPKLMGNADHPSRCLIMSIAARAATAGLPSQSLTMRNGARSAVSSVGMICPTTLLWQTRRAGVSSSIRLTRQSLSGRSITKTTRRWESCRTRAFPQCRISSRSASSPPAAA